ARSFADFEKVLPALGVSFESVNGKLPLRIKGPLQGGEATIDASLSSQFLTGLLFALPRAGTASTIHVQHLKSQPYVEMSLQVLSQFGISIEHEVYKTFHIQPAQFQPQKLRVPGDWSGAAFI